MKKIGLYIFAVLLISAGINHFIHPQFYIKIMPPWARWFSSLVFISGVAEVVIGIFLLPKITRRWAAFAAIALLIAVFPANIQMVINYNKVHNPYLWFTILRLPLQVFFIWWAWQYTDKEETSE
jgi:uncharacterized membrane protein